MSKHIELLEERAKVIEDSRAMLNKIEAEGRDFNDTELEQYNKMESDIDSLKNRSDRLKKSSDLESSLDVLNGAAAKVGISGKPQDRRATDEYKNHFETFVRNNKDRVSHEVFNSLQTGANPQGGYIVPVEFDNAIVESLQDWNDFRQYVNVIQTASDRNIPIEETLGAAAYTAEEAAYKESDAVFGQKSIGSYKATRIVKVSEELIADAFFDVSAYLTRNFGKAFGLRQEQSIVAGTGTGQPNSLLSGAGDSGVTFAGLAAITGDELIDVYHGLSRPYRRNAVWTLNDDTVKIIRKLKDGDGQYLWRQGLEADKPDTLLGKPVLTSQYMPEAGTGNKSVIFGDLSGYTWGERMGRTMQRLDELYAATGQIGFRGYERHDGVVTDVNAIVSASHA